MEEGKYLDFGYFGSEGENAKIGKIS